jgi:hypothetical protein
MPDLSNSVTVFDFSLGDFMITNSRAKLEISWNKKFRELNKSDKCLRVLTLLDTSSTQILINLTGVLGSQS